MDTILASIVGPVANAGIAIFSVLMSVGMFRMNTWLKNRTGSEALQNIGQTVQSVVSDLNATVVNQLKAETADGKLTREDASRIKRTAVKQVKEQIPGIVASAANAVVADLDRYISGKIESTVSGNKP